MNSLLSLFINNLLPIIIIAGLGYGLAYVSKLSPRSLSQTVFYILSPCLLFNALTSSKMGSDDLLKMLAFAMTIMIISGLLAFLISKVIRLERSMISAVVLPTMLMNAGNYGLPLVDFAFGKAALAQATVYFVAMSLFSYSVGTVIASMGSVSLYKSLITTLKIPSLYAALFALVFANQGWSLPLPLTRTVDLLADATIPTMLIVLGMQLHSARWTRQIKPLFTAVGMRMIAAPVIAFLLAPLFGITGSAYEAAMLQSAMPSAVLTTILATEYNAEPVFVTLVVLATTLISPITLTLLMYFLGSKP